MKDRLLAIRYPLGIAIALLAVIFLFTPCGWVTWALALKDWHITAGIIGTVTVIIFAIAFWRRK